MQVFTKTISSVFGSERRYVIPLFQRPYVWTRELQWQPLWEDIVEQAERDLRPQQGDLPPHFLGAIVIQQRKSWGDELLAHNVIDGQQRLTTFQILLAAFRDLAGTLGEKQVAAWIGALTRNANAIADPNVEQYKLWPTSRDMEQFRLVSSAGSREEVEKIHPPVYWRKKLQPRPLMVEAYLYFYDAIDEWLREDESGGIAQRCKTLRRIFDRQLQLVSIELDGQEDPQAIFETLNARGVPLLASDLLRNFIFQRAGSPAEADRLHQAYWLRFETPDNPLIPDGLRFWEMEERQGRLSRARLDLFIQHYLTMKKGDDIVNSRLFPEYKSWIQDKKPFVSVEAELKDLSGFADDFHKLLRPDAATSLGRFAARLRVLDTSTIYPLLLGLLGNPALPEAEREGIYQDLESFLVRRLVCGRPTKNYNRLFLQLLRDFNTNGKWTRAAFHSLLAVGAGESVDWPDDPTFQKAWLATDAYRELKPARVEMILRAIDAALRNSKSETVTIHGQLTVEHLMPQAWKAHWALPTGAALETATERREELIHDFGNLTLLTQELNTSLSNGPAEEKLPAIAKQSTLLLNAYFQGRTTWTEEDILERGASLFNVAKKVWPGP